MMHVDRAEKFDFDRFLQAGDLPRVALAQPVVRLLALPAVLDRLSEHAVLVTQAVAHRRQFHRRHRVEKTRGEAAQATVSQTRIGFLLEQAEPVEIPLLGGPAYKRVEE